MTAEPPAPTRRRPLLRALAASAGLLALALGGAWVGLRTSAASEPLPGTLPPEATVAALPGVFPKQGPNECGAYSLAFGLAAQGQAARGPDLVARVSHRLAWSSALSGTLPWRLTSELEARGCVGQAYTAGGVEPAARLDLVRAHVAAGDPVVVLIRSERDAQHYVLVVGYAPGRIDLYDPNFDPDPDDPERTRDANGALPGNRSFEPDTLQAAWAQGGGGGLYRWWYLPISRR